MHPSYPHLVPQKPVKLYKATSEIPLVISQLAIIAHSPVSPMIKLFLQGCNHFLFGIFKLLLTIRNNWAQNSNIFVEEFLDVWQHCSGRTEKGLVYLHRNSFSKFLEKKWKTFLLNTHIGIILELQILLIYNIIGENNNIHDQSYRFLKFRGLKSIAYQKAYQILVALKQVKPAQSIEPLIIQEDYIKSFFNQTLILKSTMHEINEASIQILQSPLHFFESKLNLIFLNILK